jgi:hypothetical protein
MAKNRHETGTKPARSRHEAGMKPVQGCHGAAVGPLAPAGPGEGGARAWMICAGMKSLREDAT